MESKDITVETSNATDLIDLAHSLIVNDAVTLGAAVKMYSEANSNKNALTEKRFTMTKPLDESKKNIINEYRGPIDIYDKVGRIIKSKIRDYDFEIESTRLNVQADLRKEYLAKKNSLVVAAANAKLKGDNEQVKALAIQANMLPLPTVGEHDKPKGYSRRETYTARVDDISALLVAVINGEVPSDFITVNQTLLNKQAQSLRLEFKCPGVGVVVTKNVILRSSGQ